jgi:hypothetical protein
VRRLITLVVILAAACGGSSSLESTEPTVAPAPGPSEVLSARPTEGAVEWQDYAPDVQSRIDELAAEKDCATLQEQFNIAVATQSDTLRRTGHNNAKLLNYINDALREAGCYL